MTRMFTFRERFDWIFLLSVFTSFSPFAPINGIFSERWSISSSIFVSAGGLSFFCWADSQNCFNSFLRTYDGYPFHESILQIRVFCPWNRLLVEQIRNARSIRARAQAILCPQGAQLSKWEYCPEFVGLEYTSVSPSGRIRNRLMVYVWVPRLVPCLQML